MNITSKRLSFGVVGVVIVLGLAFAYKVSGNDQYLGIEKLRPVEYPRHQKAGPGQVMEIWIEDLVHEMKTDHHSAIYVSAKEQQSILWISKSYEFRIESVKPDKSVPEVVQGRSQNGPFYRGFEDRRDEIVQKEFFQQVASGPVRHDAAPRSGEYKFKSTILVRLRDDSNRTVYRLDPHIMTIEGLGP